MKRRKQPEPTHTHKVFDALCRMRDEFLTMRDLVILTGSNMNQVSAALHNLRQYHAADVVVQGRIGHWFATPDSDLRTRPVEQRTPEDMPRKKRKPRATKGKPRPDSDERQTTPLVG